MPAAIYTHTTSLPEFAYSAFIIQDILTLVARIDPIWATCFSFHLLLLIPLLSPLQSFGILAFLQVLQAYSFLRALIFPSFSLKYLPQDSQWLFLSLQFYLRDDLLSENFVGNFKWNYTVELFEIILFLKIVHFGPPFLSPLAAVVFAPSNSSFNTVLNFF